MTLDHVRVVWSNWSGQPGYTNFYFASGVNTASLTALGAFFTAFKTSIPSPINITVPSNGNSYDEVSGDLVGGWSVAAPAPVVGSNAGAFAGHAGAVVLWKTNQVVDRRRVVGRSFIVPLSSGSFDTDGSLSSTMITTLQAAGNTLIAASTGFVVWHRPNPDVGRLGRAVAIANCTVPDLAAELKSRRR